MATFTTNVVSKAISSDSAAKIEDYTVRKQPPKVTKQSPAAGTPVIQGMTIEVHAVSLSDVPYKVLDATIAPLSNVALADIQRVAEGDPRILNAVQTGVIPETDRSYITEQFNTQLAQSGLSGSLTIENTSQLVNQLGASGIVGF